MDLSTFMVCQLGYFFVQMSILYLSMFEGNLVNDSCFFFILRPKDLATTLEATDLGPQKIHLVIGTSKKNLINQIHTSPRGIHQVIGRPKMAP